VLITNYDYNDNIPYITKKFPFSYQKQKIISIILKIIPRSQTTKKYLMKIIFEKKIPKNQPIIQCPPRPHRLKKLNKIIFKTKIK